MRRVYYPGLASHPEHHLAKRQMTGFGGVVSFEVCFFHAIEIFFLICFLFGMVPWYFIWEWIIILFNYQVYGDIAATRKFIDALRVPYIAPSFGSCESMVSPVAILSYWYMSNTAAGIQFLFTFRFLVVSSLEAGTGFSCHISLQPCGWDMQKMIIVICLFFFPLFWNQGP